MRLNSQTGADACRAAAATRSSSAFSTTAPLGLCDPGDHRLDLGQLGQRVQALQVQVVAADVGQHARIVRLVAQAAQQDAAARGFEHGQVHVRPVEDGVRTLRPGEVAWLDHLARPRSRHRWWSCQRGGRRAAPMWAIIRVVVLLPFVPLTLITGTLALLVSEHRRGPGRSWTAATRRAPRSAIATSAAVLFQAQCDPCDRLAFALVGPWVGDNPVAGFARAMDGDAHAHARGPTVQPAHEIGKLD